MVEEAENDSEQHVDDSQDHRHLHLEGVQEGQLVGGDVPDLWARKRAGVTLWPCIEIVYTDGLASR